MLQLDFRVIRLLIDWQIEGDFMQKPSVQVVAKIAKALGVQVEDLLK
jgi:hypothetical protein